MSKTTSVAQEINTLQFPSINDAFFTQLSQKELCIVQQAHKFRFMVELFTNVNCRRGSISLFCTDILLQFRKLLNNRVRYQQKLGNLQNFYALRFFGLRQLGRGWWSPNLKFFCSDPDIVEFIIREWCELVNLYPRELEIKFERDIDAKNAMPNRGDAKNLSNIKITRISNTIRENYYFSNPYRLVRYINDKGFGMAKFGAVANVYSTNCIHFVQAPFIKNNPFSFHIEDLYVPEGFRAFQPFGNLRTSSNTLTKQYKIPRSNSNRLATMYYKEVKVHQGSTNYNPFVYQRLKQRKGWHSDSPAIHQVVLESYMRTLEDAFEEIQRLRQLINGKPFELTEI